MRYDLAASKLVAYREKDRIFVSTLLMEELINGATVLERIRILPVDDVTRERLIRWVEVTLDDIRLAD